MPKLALLLGALAALASCSRPEYFEMKPSSVSFERRGQTMTVRGIAMDRRGVEHAGVKPARWESDDPKIAEVDEDGKITAIGPGTTRVRGVLDELKGEVLVDVNTVETFTVEPTEISLKQDGQPLKPNIRVLDFLGKDMRGRVVSARCDNEKICTADSEAKLWPQDPGETTAEFRCDDKKIRVKVVVAKTRSR
jgi:hypothetical protein